MTFTVMIIIACQYSFIERFDLIIPSKDGYTNPFDTGTDDIVITGVKDAASDE